MSDEPTEQAKSNSRRRAARKAGKEAATAEAGKTLDRFAANYDESHGLPLRRLKADTLPARLDRLKRETGKTAPKKIADLAEEFRVLVTETAALVGQNIATEEANVARLTKTEALDDAAIIREAAKNPEDSVADLGESPLAKAKADLIEHRRFAAAVRVLQLQVAAEITEVTGQKPFESFLRRVWNDSVLVKIDDSWNVGDAHAAAARSEVTFAILWDLYRGAVFANHSAQLKPLRAAWDEAVDTGSPMPTIKSLEEKLYQTGSDKRAKAEADAAAEKVRKAAHVEEVAAAAQARNPQKDGS